MRQFRPPAEPPDPDSLAEARAELQAQLAAGSIGIDVFSRAWRRLERPEPTEAISPDEIELLKARDALAKFGTIWRDPKVPDRLREQAVHELFVRFDVEGGALVAAHPQPNENAWLIGQALMNAGLLPTQLVMGMVGARGFEPPTSSSRTMRATKLRHAPTECPLRGHGMIAGESAGG